MHSWRVLITPHLDSFPGSYNSDAFAEPWDGKHVQISTSEHTYHCPDDLTNSETTNYLAVVGANAAWAGDTPRKLADLDPEPSHTIMLIEAANSGIVWTEPRDFSLEHAERLRLGVASHGLIEPPHCGRQFLFHRRQRLRYSMAMADGSVHFLRTDCLSPEDLRKVLAIGGCKNVSGGPHVVLDAEGRHLNWPNIATLAVWLLAVGVLLTKAVKVLQSWGGSTQA